MSVLLLLSEITTIAPPAGDSILLESGFFLLLESGDKILLE